MSPHGHGLTPRLKPLSSRKSATLSVLDIGTSKVVCLIAQLKPVESLDALRGPHASRPHRRHRPPALARPEGRRRRRSRGGRGLDPPRRRTRPSGWRKVEIQSVIVNLTGGRLGSQHLEAAIDRARRSGRRPRTSSACSTPPAASTRGPGRAVLHALPTGFSLDAQRSIVDPRGMIGEKLGVDLHVVTAEAAAARNLMLAVERCHLGVEAVIATPYAAGLSALVDDEAEMGVGRHRHGRRHDERRRVLRRPSRPCRRDRGRRASRHDGHRARAHDAGRRGRAPQDALRRGDREQLRRPRHDRRAAGRRGRARRPEPPAEVAPRAHHQAARRGDPRARARPPEERGLRRAGRPPRRPDGRRQPAHRPARGRRGASCRARSASAARSASRACPRPPRGRPSRPRSACSSTRRSPHVEHFEPRSAAALRRHRNGRLHLAGRALARRTVFEYGVACRRGRAAVGSRRGTVAPAGRSARAPDRGSERGKS